jgi:transcriptional regulator with XRE-family HTH domain
MTGGEVDTVLAGVGPRVRQLRLLRGRTLVDLAAETGISKSTLSRLESGQRKVSLELLLPIAYAFQVPLDELVDAPALGDPRIRLRPHERRGRVVIPLSEHPSGMHVWKVVIPPEDGPPDLRTHDGQEWLYVLAGELRVVLPAEDMTLVAGEAVEFDASVPHWFGAADRRAVEIISILSHRGHPIRRRSIGRGARRTR